VLSSRWPNKALIVSALVDLYDDDSYLVEIPAGQPAAMQITSLGSKT